MDSNASEPAVVEPETVTVRFSSSSGPVSGTVVTAGGSTEFHGWLELMDALEAARTGAGVAGPA